MLYTLEQVLADRKPPFTVRHDATILDALKIMMEHRLNQLPVVDEAGLLKGIVSQQSILGIYFLIGSKVSLLDLKVSDCLEPAVTLSVHEDLLAAVDQLRRRGTYAVIVIDEARPVGILTGKDMSIFFHSLFEGLLLVERIERYFRQIIAAAFPDEAARNQALIAAFGIAKGNPDKPARGERYLSFTDMIVMIYDFDNWPRFQPVFESREYFSALLERVRTVRNQIAHFRGHPTILDLDTLRRAITWLDNRPPLLTSADQQPATVGQAQKPAEDAQSLANVLAGRKPPVCVELQLPLREVLRTMIGNRFGQLPIVDEHGLLLGMVSQQSILRTYFHSEGEVDLLDLPVVHCMEPATTLHLDDDLFTAANLLALSGVYAPVVVDGDKPVGILTGKDMTHFFRALFEGVILVERIENKLRDCITQAFPDRNALNTAAMMAFGPWAKDPQQPARNPARWGFGDNVIFICDDDVWPAFSQALGPREMFMHLMDRVRRVRNDLLHFRGNLSYSQYDALQKAHIWITQQPAVSAASPLPTPDPSAPVKATANNPYYEFMGRTLRTLASA